MSEPVFKKVDYTLGPLLAAIELGQIGLPDLQRPFVWKNAKVRDLLDSLHRGYPVGYFLFWETAAGADVRTIGTDGKQVPPNLLIVDGQQRLTALYAVVKGVEIVREDYRKERIELSFCPLDRTFEVADAATRNDARYIPNISALWAKNADLFQIVATYIDRLRAARAAGGEDLTQAEVKDIQREVQRLSNLLSFPLTALVLVPTISEEQVSEVFVRINSQGKALNQSDFILTLMSVFWDEGRAALEAFCRDARVPTRGRPGPHNAIIEPMPDQLLRAAIGVGFRRARLQYVYSLLRGKALDTGEFSSEQRLRQFRILMSAQEQVLDLQHWHDFLGIMPLAGVRSSGQITSINALLMAYILFLIGRTQHRVDPFSLKNAIAQWFFMSSLTARYTGGAPETAMERDLAALRDVATGEQLLGWLRSNIEVELTTDFWRITLPSRLRTSAARSPALFAYYAALVILDARVLFSKKKVADLLDPARKAKRAAIERHHLFPKKHLQNAYGIASTRDTNQIANFALVEWDDNAAIRARGPSEYAPDYISRFKGQELAEMYYWHALTPDWFNLPYDRFLEERGKLIARVIHDAFYRVDSTPVETEVNALGVQQMIQAGEGPRIEYKSTLRLNLATGQPDSKIEHASLKSIAAFMNSDGGTLLVGVSDEGTVLGIDRDGFPNDDKLTLHLVNLVRAHLGAHNHMYLDVHYETLDAKRVLVVTCRPAGRPVFVKDGQTERFFIRALASSQELLGAQAQHYIAERFVA